MRNISANGLAKLTQQYGAEPIIVVEVGWVSGQTRSRYADKTIPQAPGRILEVSGLESVIQISQGSSSQEISVKLDDTDGTVKNILDSHDVHKRPVWVYQFFTGLDYSDDRALLFKGEISSPLTWNEGERTVSFTVLSKIEDTECGFSIEEGEFDNPPEDLIGRPWPLCFGTVVRVPALRAKSIVQGTLARGVGIHDFTLHERIAKAEFPCPSNPCGVVVRPGVGTSNDTAYAVAIVCCADDACVKSNCERREELQLQLDEQKALEFSTFRVYGGEKFPQNRLLTIDINGAKFKGRFDGEEFKVSSRIHPLYDPATGTIKKTPTGAIIDSRCGFGNGLPPGFNTGGGGGFGNQPCGGNEANAAAAAEFGNLPTGSFFWAEGGATVTLDQDNQIVYIANLLPSTIIRVDAWRNFNGARELLEVPEKYYTIRQVDYTGYPGVMEIVLQRPLSSQDEGWEDELYVTMTSSVGPNTVDIVRWFIETYTDYGIDETSFNTVRSQIDNYPMHFPLLERKNIITVLEEIAFQARCAIWLKNDVFFIKYLPAEEEAVETITESDVQAKTLELFHTATEDLVTKYVANWKRDYANDRDNKLILRHKVIKYGTHEEDYNFYCYNILRLVRKSATFWLIRHANTWRKVKFETAIDKLRLEPFDTVLLDLPDISPSPFKAIVEKANYNSENHTIQFECWTPLLSGTTTPYDFAWPANISETKIFPTLEERELKYAGSGKEPNFSTIAPRGHVLNPRPPLGMSLPEQPCNESPTAVSFGETPCKADSGENNPSDADDVKPGVPTPESGTASGSEGTGPIKGLGEGENCCKKAQEALQKAEQALREAKSAGANAAAAGTPDEVDNPEDVLPQQCGGHCQAAAIVEDVRIDCIVPDGSLFPKCDSGRGAIVAVTTTTRKCVTFNSDEAAKAYVDGINQSRKGRQGSVGDTASEYRAAIAKSMGGEIGPDGNPTGQLCQEPPEEGRGRSGQTKPQMAGNSIEVTQNDGSVTTA